MPSATLPGTLPLTLGADPYVNPHADLLLPDTALTIIVTDAAGNTSTLDSYAADPGYRPMGITHGSQQGSGFYMGGFHLSWPIDREHPALHLRDKVQMVGANGDVAYEGFIIDLPRSTDADGRGTLTVQLAGYMADTARASFRMPFVDRDLANFTISPSMKRRGFAVASRRMSGTAEAVVDPTDGLSAVVLQHTRIENSATNFSTAEAWYDSAGVPLSQVYYDVTTFDRSTGTVITSGGAWRIRIHMLPGDDAAVSDFAGFTGGSSAGYLTATTNDRTFIALELFYEAALTADGEWRAQWRKLAAYGKHGLPLIGDTDPKGVAASDVIRYLIDTYCPKLNTGGVQDTAYPIGHLAFRERTKVYDALLKVNNFHLWQLAVWEGGTVHYGPADLSRHDWQARHDEVGVQVGLQGDSVEQLRNGIIVSFTNVATGAAAELHPDDYAELRDDSVSNPWNEHGDKSYGEPFTVPFPTTQANALELGRLRMIEDNAVRAPGVFTVGPWIEDATGARHPVWKVRAGQTIRLTSSAQLSDRPRLIQEVSYSHDGKTATIAVDSTLRLLDGYVDRVLTSLQAAGLQQ